MTEKRNVERRKVAGEEPEKRDTEQKRSRDGRGG